METEEIEADDTEMEPLDVEISPDENNNDSNSIDINPPGDVDILEEIRPDVDLEDQFPINDVDL